MNIFLHIKLQCRAFSTVPALFRQCEVQLAGCCIYSVMNIVTKLTSRCLLQLKISLMLYDKGTGVTYPSEIYIGDMFVLVRDAN
jgi:hypothetical protein